MDSLIQFPDLSFSVCDIVRFISSTGISKHLEKYVDLQTNFCVIKSLLQWSIKTSDDANTQTDKQTDGHRNSLNE